MPLMCCLNDSQGYNAHHRQQSMPILHGFHSFNQPTIMWWLHAIQTGQGMSTRDEHKQRQLLVAKQRLKSNSKAGSLAVEKKGCEQRSIGWIFQIS